MNNLLIQKTKKELSSGRSDVFGATIGDDGVNFAIFSKYAKDVWLLLFDKHGAKPTDVIKLNRREDAVWTVFVRGIKAGQLYGYKIDGFYQPEDAMRFNANKLLMDPYGKAFVGDFKNSDGLLLGYDAGSPKADMSFDARDNVAIAPKSVVVDDGFDWQNDARPNIPLEKLIIYETHLKGFTAHKSSHVKHPGTYLGFIEKISYLKDLGINAVEFLPIQQFFHRDGLVKMGLKEYWGYNTVGFFAPENSYSTCRDLCSPVEEFKTLVRELHKAGIEVILDVVYNHTGEGDELGPTLCFRGIDNSTYYALTGRGSQEPYRFYVNDTGCGNMLNAEHPVVRRMILDSLRYWTDVMHVDGFRFDLASILPRLHGRYSKEAAFFHDMKEDPVLKKVKLIAEPWDLKTYQVGNFPFGWSEWNGKFRDTTRRFIKGDGGQAKEFSLRLMGSPDLYGDDGRTPYDSINFITAHDGFTMADLYSYNGKHNEANGEKNRDGTDENFSWNCGIEGAAADQDVLQLRRQMIKNALSCLLIPLGTPMLLGGDEFMRTQKGNNNAYCQDNEISWFDWRLADLNKGMIEFVKKVIAFRKRYTILQHRKFDPGKSGNIEQAKDIIWFGKDLDRVRWDDPEIRTICCHLDGRKDPEAPGNYHLFFVLNADYNGHTVKIPQFENIAWHRVLHTTLEYGKDILDPGHEELISPSDNYYIHPRCVVGLIGK